MSLSIALPKGRLLGETAARLQEAQWGLEDYTEQARLYRLEASRFPGLRAKIFHERDIPIQVAVGNYDLGICGRDWIEELLARYPSSPLVRVKDMGYGGGALYLAANRSAAATVAALRAATGVVRIASEYPNLAESLAARFRLRRFSIFPLWGAAEVYPPENAELVLITGDTQNPASDLVPVSRVLDYGAVLIANRDSYDNKDMAEVIDSIAGGECPRVPDIKVDVENASRDSVGRLSPDTVRLALPDGHQQAPTRELLDRAGIRLEKYLETDGNRRPATDLEGVSIKVVRPQDMPLQVANGNFDLAVTGRDWLREHLYQFPASPVAERLDLGFGGVRIVAVVSQDLPVRDDDELRWFVAGQEKPFRVASEYVNIADKYARDNHLGVYRVVPTWGATEAFLPEDADLLIENTETGSTIARHNLRIIDTLFTSTACLVGNKGGGMSDAKSARIESIIERLRDAVEDV